MGCTAAKQNKLEGKLSSSQNKTSHETLASPASLMQETDKIDGDYIFHAMDPLISIMNQ